jgi:hypothetical protein
MGRKHRSARGELVDLDLIKIKQEIASAPKPVNVTAREEFIDKKIRRKIKRKKGLPDIPAVDVENSITEENTDTDEELIENKSVETEGKTEEK